MKTIDSEKRPWVIETPFAEDNRAGKKTVSEREAVGTPISAKIVQEEVKKWLHQRRGKLKPLFLCWILCFRPTKISQIQSIVVEKENRNRVKG